MPVSIVATKLYLPSPRREFVLRPRLVDKLNEGLAQGHKLILISAPAGFGKTTLVSEWVVSCGRPVAWLSLDEGDNDPARFITYLTMALQVIKAGIGASLMSALQSPEPPQTEVILTALLNEIAAIPDNFVLVLDDYHVVDSQQVDRSLAFFIEHQPPQMHLVIITREDPSLPLSRLRARGQLTELRAADLRFTPFEAAEFLNQVMGLSLSSEDIAALETRTEGWVAGLQLAALSMQGHASRDAAGFIQSFTGSNRFVLDYLIEEVLGQQIESVQTFLVRTSILERMCAPLCDAVLLDSSVSGQATLEYLERANLFVVPLDNERRWYRYHHLFAELLRQRLGQSLSTERIAELHIHASAWYENNDLMLEAFRHAAAANDIKRAERLMESKKMPLHLRGTATTILNWLESLPKSVLDAKPALWWGQAAMLLVIGQLNGVEEKLQAVESVLASTALPDSKSDDTTRDLIGKIAAARANLAQLDYQSETILIQGQRALEYLHPDNLADRSMAIRAMGFAYYSQNNLAEAGRAYTEALSLARAAGDEIDAILALIRLSQLQEEKSQLRLAAETYQQLIKMVDAYSPYNAPLVFLGLARIHYEWNDLTLAEQYGEQSVQLARQYDQVIDRLISSELFMAHLKLARGDAAGAAQYLSQAEQTTREKNYTLRLPHIAFTKVFFHLYQGNIEAAAELVRQNELPLMQARVLIRQDDPSAALAILEPLHQQAEAKGSFDRLLRVTAVRSIAHYALGEQDKAMERLDEALTLAEPEGFIRLFLDEGEPMRLLISDFRSTIAAHAPPLLGYVDRILASFPQPMEDGPQSKIKNRKHLHLTQVQVSEIVEPLSERELEVLKLLRSELSGPEIAERLIVSLNTLRTHTKNIFNKLGVNNRRSAVRRAEELDLF